ncbi:hypothetical protein B0H13DRAFT_2281267 [Mycena leptocephala]|nr:hypothetical protein B0H13DRAFT_2281267 [Mycena leptocephala]
MPSPIRKTASRKGLAAEVDQLHSLLKGVGYDLDHNYGHMVLMEHENKNMRQQLFAKNNKAKRAYTTGKARLMTSTEIQEELLKALQKKQMAEMHAGLKKLFPAIKKQISEALKLRRRRRRQRRRRQRSWRRRPPRLGKRPQGGGGGRAGDDEASRGKAQDSSDEEESGPEPDTSEDDSDFDERSASASPGPSATNIEPSDEEGDSDEPAEPASHGLATPLEPQYVSDDDDESDQEETGIISFNGHRWESRRNLQSQVVWRDGDVTWEPLFNVNDCAAMEGYLAHRDVDDPLRLSKRKFLIDKGLRASNEQTWLTEIFPRLAGYLVFAVFGLAAAKYSPSHRNIIKSLALWWPGTQFQIIYFLSMSIFAFASETIHVFILEGIFAADTPDASFWLSSSHFCPDIEFSCWIKHYQGARVLCYIALTLSNFLPQFLSSTRNKNSDRNPHTGESIAIPQFIADIASVKIILHSRSEANGVVQEPVKSVAGTTTLRFSSLSATHAPWGIYFRQYWFLLRSIQEPLFDKYLADFREQI